jgi:predicted Zn-dependent peptidase
MLGLCAVMSVGAEAQKNPPIAYRGAPQNVKQFEVGGIPVILRPTGPANHVVAAKLFIKGGLAALPAGVSPAVQQLALELPPLSGPQSMDRQAYRRLIDRMVTGIVPSDERDFSTLLLRCVDENFDRSWDLFTGVILQPRFDETELRNAKSRLVSGIRNRLASPESYAEYLADSAFFYGHPYGRLAQEADVAPIDASTLEEYYRKLYVKSRLLLVVVGNIDSADLHRKIAGSLAKLPQGNYVDIDVPQPVNGMTSNLIIRRPLGRTEGSPTTYIVARHLAPNKSDSLYYPMLRLASFVSGSLFREIRIERNLSYAPDADVVFLNSSYGDISMSTTLPDSAWRTAKREVIDFFRDYVIAEEYMKSGMSSWITSNYMREQTNESQAHELGVAQIYTGSWTNAFRTIDALRSMSSEEMNEAARRYMQNFTIAVVGDPRNVTPSVFLPASDMDNDAFESTVRRKTKGVEKE